MQARWPMSSYQRVSVAIPFKTATSAPDGLQCSLDPFERYPQLQVELAFGKVLDRQSCDRVG